MAKIEKIGNIQIVDNKEDKFFYFPMISMACTGCRDHHLPVHDAFPTGRHLDTAGAMDADRAGYLCVLRHQA